MLSALLQDWVIRDGTGTTPVVQSELGWLDLAAFGDVTFWLEVRSVSRPGAGEVILTYETSPSDDVPFTAVGSVILSASSAPVLTKVTLSGNPALGRFVRWSLQGTAAGNWSASFRVFATPSAGASGGFNPGMLPLSGWWRATYPGAPPWSGVTSTGASGGRDLTSFLNSTTDPIAGTAVNGFTPADFDGADDALTSAVANNLLFGSSGSLFCLFNADTAPAASGSDYGDGTFVTDITNAETTFGFTSAGISGCVLDDSVTYQRISVACGTGAWHLAQFKFDGSTLKARVDGDLWSSVPCGPYVAVNPSSNTTIGQSYTALHFDGLILELGISATALSDADFESIRSYINARYGLSL